MSGEFHARGKTQLLQSYIERHADTLKSLFEVKMRQMRREVHLKHEHINLIFIFVLIRMFLNDL